MSQTAKIIDVTRSFIITDPNAFMQNDGYTQREDQPEDAIKRILGYEGYNFMPTSYGYRAFFGKTPVDIDPLPPRCDKILLFQFATYQNILVALAEDGIWIARPSTSGNAWVHEVTLAVPSVGTYRLWTYALIQNVLYMYRATEAHVWKIGPTDINVMTDDVTITELTPSFLNMAGQQGIFRANNRLGFWDSANSIAWSALFDVMDLTPKIETLASNAIYQAIIGRIVMILSQGDGFVIYCTKSIVGVRWVATGSILWEANSISDNAGIFTPNEVTRGLTDLEHYAYTSSGIKHIGGYNQLQKSHAYDDIIPDVYDFLKESRQPVYLQCINGRYLTFSLLDANYINGIVSFYSDTIPPYTIILEVGDEPWDGVTVLPTILPAHTITTVILHKVTNGFISVEEDEIPTYRINASYLRSWMGSPINRPFSGFQYNEDPFPDFSFRELSNDDEFFTPDLNVSYPGVGTKFGNTQGNIEGEFFSTRVSPRRVGFNEESVMDIMHRQQAEWGAFTTQQRLLKAQIEDMEEGVDTVQGSILYHNDQPLTSPSSTQEFVNYLISGVGPTKMLFNSNSREIILRKIFTERFPVQQNIDTTYSKRNASIYGSWHAAGVVPFDVSGIIYTNFPTLTAPTPEFASTEIDSLTAYMTACHNAAPSSQVVSGNVYDKRSLADSLATLRIRYTRTLPTSDTRPVYDLRLSPEIAAGIVTSLAVYHDREETKTYEIEPKETGNYGFAQLVATQSGINGVIPNESGDGYITKIVKPSVIPPSEADDDFDPSELFAEFGTDVIIIEGVSRGISPFDPAKGQMGDYYYDMEVFTHIDPPIEIPGYTIPGYRNIVPGSVYNVIPGATFLLQDGSLGPIYPTFYGALVFDLALKKWGKLKAEYKCLYDYSPINDVSQDGIAFTNFGMDMGMLNEDGETFIFNSVVEDSKLRYGKIGLYRLGFTLAHEVIIHFRSPFTGQIILDASLDGNGLEHSLKKTHNIVNERTVTVPSETEARFHTIQICGEYDLQLLQFRGTITSKL